MMFIGLAALLLGMGLAATKLLDVSLALLIFGPIGFVSIVYALFSPHFYRCPQCGTRLSFRAPPQDGVSIKHFCRRCDVEWNTGWVASTDGPQSTEPSKADVPLPDGVQAQIKEALYQGRKIDAIKQCRDSTGASLSDAVYRMGRLEDDLRHEFPERFTHARKAPNDAASP